MNTLYYGDNLEILRKHVGDESVDLIYLDPPFNSKRAYNVIFQDKTGRDSAAQIQAFEDTWTWTPETQDAFEEIMTGKYPAQLQNMMKAFREFLGINNMMAYLTMMAIRLVELHRVLKDTGSIYLHCDPTASHYLKILLDQIFGVNNFLNEIAWKRTHAHGSSHRYGPIHDILLYYAKSENWIWTYSRRIHDDEYLNKFFRQTDEISGRRFQAISLTGPGKTKGDSGKPWRGINPSAVNRHWALPGNILKKLNIEESLTLHEKLEKLDELDYIYWPKKEKGIPRLKHFTDDLEGEALLDIWDDIPPVSAHAKERLPFPTQKPVALLERVLQASSNAGDIILDPFCGCGTAVVAAEKLGRRWIGIDVTHLAIALIKKRMGDHFPDVKYKVVGEPKSVYDAQKLFEQSAFQFEAWAVSLIGGQPYKSQGGADRGIDGLIFFEDAKSNFHKIILSVKGGGYHPKDVRELKAVLEREEAPMGIVIALQPPTKGMLSEAAAMGKWQMPGMEIEFPIMQIITMQEIFDGQKPLIPQWHETLKKANREIREREKTLKLW